MPMSIVADLDVLNHGNDYTFNTYGQVDEDDNDFTNVYNGFEHRKTSSDESGWSESDNFDNNDNFVSSMGGGDDEINNAPNHLVRWRWQDHDLRIQRERLGDLTDGSARQQDALGNTMPPGNTTSNGTARRIPHLDVRCRQPGRCLHRQARPHEDLHFFRL